MKNENWHNFLSRRDFDLRLFLKVTYFESVSVEKIKLHAFSGVQYCFKTSKETAKIIHSETFKDNDHSITM